MTEPAVPPEREPLRYRVLSVRSIWLAAVVIVLVGLGTAVWLLFAFGDGDAQSRNQLETVKTAGAIVIGAGGAVALLLAARRQRSAEIALKQKDREQAHQERVAEAAEADAAERRITELYTKAADQLGSDKAPVRLAGLYALERVAQNNTEQRQTIVNVLCAYLRMPYRPPEGAEERQVRLTAQRLLTEHLTPERTTFWADIALDLTGAVLLDFDLGGCAVRSATFMDATFVGGGYFVSARFTGRADFWSADFLGEAKFNDADFLAGAHFGRATFNELANFNGATFAGTADFQSAAFAKRVIFWRSTFARSAGTADMLARGEHTVFEGARFARETPAELSDYLSH